jgi:hypothetical protein
MLCEALGCSERTIYRLDLPYIVVGWTRWYGVEQARQKFPAPTIARQFISRAVAAGRKAAAARRVNE